MIADAKHKPRILRALPGRIRVHLPHWSGHGQRHLEQRIALSQASSEPRRTP